LKIQTQRAIDKWIGIPLCAALSAWDRLASLFKSAPRAAAQEPPPQRILVILLSEMGSLVLARPMFERLRESHPQAQLHALMFGKNREVLDLMGVMPPENVVTLDDRSGQALVFDTLRALRELRALKLDVAIDCELFARIGMLFSRLSGARIRVGFHRHTQEGLYRGDLLHRPVPYNPYRHIADQFLALAEAIGRDGTPRSRGLLPREAADYALPRLDPPAAEVQASRERLHREQPSVAGKRLVLVYAGGGILPIRAWPVEHYVALCSSLLARGLAVGVIGLKDDREIAQRIRAACADPACIDLTGYTRNIRELLVLFHHAELLVTNDGGPGQFAAMTPIHSVVLFGPETPRLYGSLSPRSISIHLERMPCSPCLTAYNHRESPCDGDNQCLKRITPEQVLARCEAALGLGRSQAQPASGAHRP
jgi:ADP-heptose:LPS heptosyltransferase